MGDDGREKGPEGFTGARPLLGVARITSLGASRSKDAMRQLSSRADTPEAGGGSTRGALLPRRSRQGSAASGAGDGPRSRPGGGVSRDPSAGAGPGAGARPRRGGAGTGDEAPGPRAGEPRPRGRGSPTREGPAAPHAVTTARLPEWLSGRLGGALGAGPGAPAQGRWAQAVARLTAAQNRLPPDPDSTARVPDGLALAAAAAAHGVAAARSAPETQAQGVVTLLRAFCTCRSALQCQVLARHVTSKRLVTCLGALLASGEPFVGSVADLLVFLSVSSIGQADILAAGVLPLAVGLCRARRGGSPPTQRSLLSLLLALSTSRAGRQAVLACRGLRPMLMAFLREAGDGDDPFQCGLLACSVVARLAAERDGPRVLLSDGPDGGPGPLLAAMEAVVGGAGGASDGRGGGAVAANLARWDSGRGGRRAHLTRLRGRVAFTLAYERAVRESREASRTRGSRSASPALGAIAALQGSRGRQGAHGGGHGGAPAG